MPYTCVPADNYLKEIKSIIVNGKTLRLQPFVYKQ